MSSSHFYDDEASEAPASEVSTDEEGEFLSDGEENELHSSDLSEEEEEVEEEESDEEEEEDNDGENEARRPPKKKRSRSKYQNKHKRKRRRRYLKDEHSEEEEDDSDKESEKHFPMRRKASSSRVSKERKHRRKEASPKATSYKKKKAISKKRPVRAGRFEEDDGDEFGESSGLENDHDEPSRRKHRIKQATLPFHVGNRKADTPSKKKGTKSKKNKRASASFDSRDSPRKSPSKAVKRNKKRRTVGLAIQHLQEKIESSQLTFKLFKGRMSPKDADDADSPIQCFKVLINGRAHIVGVQKEIVMERKVSINRKKPWVRYDAHAFSPTQIYNFLDNLEVSKLISSNECEYIKMPKKKQEGSTSIANSFFLVIPHFRNEGEVILFVVPDEVARLALLWCSTRMLDLAIAGESKKAISIGSKIVELNPPFTCFNQRWARVQEVLQNPGQKDLDVMLRIFSGIKGLSEAHPKEGGDPVEATLTPATSDVEGKKKKEVEPQNPISSENAGPAVTTSVLLDHPLLSTLVQKQEVLDTTLHKILDVLQETKEILRNQSGTMAKSVLESKTHLDEIERALDRSTSNSVYKSSSSPKKNNGVAVVNGIGSKQPILEPTTTQVQASPTKTQVLPTAGTSSSVSADIPGPSSAQGIYSSQSVSDMLENM